MERARLGGYDELVQDEGNRLTLRRAASSLSKITPEWRKQVFADADSGVVKAEWPGGVGELHSADEV